MSEGTSYDPPPQGATPIPVSSPVPYSATLMTSAASVPASFAHHGPSPAPTRPTVSTSRMPSRPFASFAAAASGGGASSSSSSRRLSVPSSPSPRVHRATGSFQWGGAPTPVVIPGSGGVSPTGAAPATPPPPFFARPPYLEHTAFKDLFKHDMFSRNPQPPSLSTSSSSSKPPSRGPGQARRATSLYSSSYLHHISGTTTPSPGASDVEDNDYTSLPTARPRDSGQQRKLTIRPEEESLILPTRWNELDRHASVQISADGRDLTFLGSQGHVNPDKEEAASARTNHPIPPACGVYYYEVEITNRGARGHIGVGFATKHPKLAKLPGWDVESWGYHGDDGNAFFHGAERPYGPRFGTNDVVGCGIDFTTRKIFFTKNGVPLGPVHPGIGPDMELYPFVGLRSSRESVKTNFGQHPFRFDIESYVMKIRNDTWNLVQDTRLEWQIDSRHLHLKASGDDPHARGASNSSMGFSLPHIPSGSFSVDDAFLDASPTVAGREADGDNVHAAMKELVLEYLVQSGYPGSALAFKKQCDQERESAARASQDVQDADTKRLGSKKTESSSRPSLRSAESNGDIKMASVESLLLPPTISTPTLQPRARAIGEGMDIHDAVVRRRVMDAISRGDVDAAMEDLDTYYPLLVRDGDTPEKRAGGWDSKALNGDGEKAGVRFKLRCRKLVEMVLEAAGGSSSKMDVDTTHHPPLSYKQQQKQKAPPPSDSATLLESALAYGQSLHADYGNDKRPKVQALLKKTSSLVAYENPLNATEAGEDVVRFAGQEARDRLAREVNAAILESQRRTTDSMLVRIYTQASGVVRQLAVLGEGKAAFTDMHREFSVEGQ